MNGILKLLPEAFFIGLGGLWAAENYFADGYINYSALLVSWLIFIQAIYRNRILGLVYSGSLTIGSLYLAFAVLLQFEGFSGTSTGTITLLFGGMILCLIAAGMGGAMFYKYLKAEKETEESVLTVTF